MKIKLFVVIAFIFILILLLFFYKLASVSDRDRDRKPEFVWDDFSKWYDWKVKTELTPQQRRVVDYLENTKDICKLPDETVYKNSGKFDVQKSILIAQDGLNQLDRVTVPAECAVYNKAIKEKLKIILAYHKKIESGASSEEIEKEKSRMLGVDGVIFGESFNSLKKVGLFDNLDEEVKYLKK